MLTAAKTCQIPLLKTLGYDFEFSNWTGLSAIRQRAERDEAVFRALHHSLRARSKHVGDKVKTEQGASLVFTSSIREVARKVHVCAMIMAVVVFRANRQRWELSEHVDSVHTAPNAQLEGESCFVPGRRIIFTHDTEEMWKTRKVYGATLADE